ncbi:S-crystallin SL11 [Patella vulgata]|uniref:S-crystallin SL11 n=1 Tax=Patella vulgata TaxID=6465 RepID=UPI00217FF5BB|nr:S-crystallin SL11 [Patella vulgata]
MPTYRYIYFDLRGRGEIVRLCFHAAGVKFEDVRIEHSAWPGKCRDASPFGQLPYLEIDGKKFPQSLAISQYIAREHGLYGNNSLENLSIDGVVGLTIDYFNLWAKANFEKDANRKTELQTKLNSEDLPTFLQQLEKLLTENKTGYFVGKKLTLADLAVYSTLENSFRDFPDVYTKYPQVVGNRKKVGSQPQLTAYLSSRKPTNI